VWEGVTQYLKREAVDSTFDVIRHLAGPDSTVIVTYVDRRALTEPSPFPEARRWVGAVARVGEPWIFGLLPEDAPSFFAKRGFVLQRDLSTLDASREWLSDPLASPLGLRALPSRGRPSQRHSCCLTVTANQGPSHL